MSWRVQIRISADRRCGVVVLLALAVLAAVLISGLVWGRQEAAAAGPPARRAAPARTQGYYLTTNTGHTGTTALSACTDGYHMASLWEILDPSNLQYNTSLGAVRADSGSGPPTGLAGWVRTGSPGESVWTAGLANCHAWTGGSGAGTLARLPGNWVAGAEDIHVWEVGTRACTSSARVWCVEDITYAAYLPLALRSPP